MLVKGWMTADVITIDEDTLMMKASIIMKEKKIRSLPIVDKKRKLVGIVTDRDLRDASPSKATTLDVYELNYILNFAPIDKEIKGNHLGFLLLLGLRNHKAIMRRYPDGKTTEKEYQEKAQW